MTILPRLVAGLLCAASAAGQIVPAAMDGVEGASASIIPFGLSGPVRYQCIYDGDQLPWNGPRLITEVRFRADWDNGDPTPVKQFLRMDVDLSTTAQLAEAASPAFDANHGSDRTQVANFLQVSLPQQPAMTGDGPRPATVAIPFPVPWWYGTTPVFGGPQPTGLVVDLQVTSQPSGIYRLDSPFTCESNITEFGSIDIECQNSQLYDPVDPVYVTITSTNDIRAGGSVTWNIDNMIPDTVFAVILSVAQGGEWLGVPLPAPLHPTDAPGCFVNVRMDMAVLPGFADSNGSGAYSLGIPSDRDLVGTVLYAQAIARDLGANPFGHVTSLGVHSTVCGPLGCARVYSIGNAHASSGNVTFGAASVIEVP